LGWIENRKVRIEEIYRFENRWEEKVGQLCWNLDRLCQKAVKGLKCCQQINRIVLALIPVVLIMFIKARNFLMIPECLNFLLTGETERRHQCNTTQMINAHTQDWDDELIEQLGLTRKSFGKLQMPKSSVGYLLPEIPKSGGFAGKVLLMATYDKGYCGLHRKELKILLRKSKQLPGKVYPE
jgi:rhamnulokinase